MSSILGPAPHQPRPAVTPGSTPVGEWYTHGWQLQATCQCGRVSIVHMGLIIRKLGGGLRMGNGERVAGLCRCIRCGRRGPAVTVVEA